MAEGALLDGEVDSGTLHMDEDTPRPGAVEIADEGQMEASRRGSPAEHPDEEDQSAILASVHVHAEKELEELQQEFSEEDKQLKQSADFMKKEVEVC